MNLTYKMKILLLLTLLGTVTLACSGQNSGTTATTADASADVPLADAGTQTDAVAQADTGTPTAAKFELLSVTPAQGRASGGELITLTGTGFVDGMQVMVGGAPLDPSGIFVYDDTTLQLTTPPHETGLVDLTIVLPGTPPLTSTLTKSYLYFNDVVVTKVDPPQGPTAGGTAISIHGTGFSGATQVLVGGKPALGLVVLADDTLTAITPPGAFGAAPVHVITQLGTGLLKKGFFYTAAPTVTSVAPASGPTAGGNAAIIRGTGLSKDVDLQIGSGKASIVEIKGTTEVHVLMPPGAAGKADVTATSSSGSGTLPGGYVYTDDSGQASTQILSIAPPSGPLAGGNSVAIIATGLVSSSDTTVLFGQKSALILNVDPAAHTVLVRVPAGASAGPVDVALLTTKGSDKAIGGYSYSDALTVSGLSPSAGPSEGGTKISISGSGFSKGGIAVKIGPLPASAVAVVSDTEIQAITPPGTPGYADVTVIGETAAATLPSAFTYTGGQLALYVVYPPTGAQAGGTLVHVYGQGFDPNTTVTFGGNAATHFTFIDPSHVSVKTPPGKVGSVDVSVKAGGASATLVNGFAYFNPASTYGGTWGSAVDGSINVTVLEAQSDKPIPDAFTMLWVDPTTPYQGFTNADGQITFSGDDLLGKQMISASKTGYQAASVVLFDAQNVTIHLSPTSPPASGNPPPGKIPPSISGHVIGVDKYIFIPTGTCNNFAFQGPGTTCNSCLGDAECGSGFACVDLGADGNGSPNGKRCVADCSQAGQTCPSEFKCAGVGTAGYRCVPAAGEVASVCLHTKPDLFSAEEDPPEGPKFIADPVTGYAYKIAVAPGEQAVICFGGYKDFGAVLQSDDANSMAAFTPTVMGIKRHIQVQPEQQITGVDVTLDIPLGQSANVRLDRPPVWASPYSIANFVQPMLMLGSDGVLRWPTSAYKFAYEASPDLITLKNLPNAFAGILADASLTLETFVVDLNNPTQMPRSINIKDNVKALTDDRMIRRVAGGDFESVETGVKKNIYGMWGTSSSNVYAVGAVGTLWHWDGGGWTQQANPLAASGSTFDWRGIHGTDSQNIFAVGSAGAAAVFNGTVWKAVPVANAENLTGVFASTGTGGSGGISVFASGQSGIFTYNGTSGWQKVGGIFGNYLGIHGSDSSHIWAVGMTGAVAVFDGSSWKTQVSGSSIALHAVWAASSSLVFAVGEKGIILKYDGKSWKPMTSGVNVTLSAVWGSSSDDVWAVGARGTVLHFNGKTWAKIALSVTDKLLDALWLNAAGDFFALGEQELLVTPILYPPLAVMPLENGVLTGNLLQWKVDTSFPEPHFNWVTIGIPNPMAPTQPQYDTPVWGIVQKGSASQVELPDLPSIQGTPGIPKGKQLRLTIIRGYMEGFDIDGYVETDLNPYRWQAWSENEFLFTAQ